MTATRKILDAPGIEYQNNKFSECRIKYKLTSDTEVGGYGKFVTFEAARNLIEAYWHEIKQRSSPETPIDNEIVSITIGKEILMMILSQPGCEGIRLYHAKGITVNSNPNEKPTYTRNDNGANTLIAIGVDAQNNDLGVTLKDNEKIGNKESISIMSPLVKSSESMKDETNPPNTYGTIFNNEKFLQNKYSLEHAFKNFMNESTI